MSRQRRHQDHFGRRAKQEGWPARSVYKLEEIDQKWHLLGKGSEVLDLGCAPGSWLRYAAAQVGPTGRVVGYDLKPLTIDLPSHATARVGDVFELAVQDIGGPYDLVLSDMAPATMGHHATDAARSAALVELALHLASQVLRPGGSVVVKVLEGRDMPQIVKSLRMAYQRVERVRPKATRRESTEIFLLGMGLVGMGRQESPNT